MGTLKDSAHAFTQLILSAKPPPEGALKGYIFAVKDVFDVEGLRIQAGNPDYFIQAPFAIKTAPAVAALEMAGATLVGKTQTDELGASLFGLNAHYGPPLNTQSPDRVPGGSSSGSAAAVAANLVDFALGADTSGSVRAPASFCGIYGLRPTFGQISTEGTLPICTHLDTVGLLAKTPGMIGQILEVYGMKDQLKITRIRPIPTLIDGLKKALKKPFLEKLAFIDQVVPSSKTLDLKDDTLIQWRTVIRTLALYDLWQVHKVWILESNPKFGELVKERITLGQGISHDDYKHALKKKKEIRAMMEGELEPGDVAIFPTVHDVPPLLTSSLADLRDFTLEAARHTCIAALAGFPEISIPLRNIVGNCSLGMSILGRPGDDRSLTSFAEKVKAP